MNQPLVNASDSRIDVTQLLTRVREVARSTQGVIGEVGALRASTAGILDDLDQALSVASEYWDIGARLPQMSRFRGPLKRAATGVAKVVLRVAELVTRDQRTFNEATLRALRALRDVIATPSTAVGTADSEAPATIAALQRRIDEQDKSGKSS